MMNDKRIVHLILIGLLLATGVSNGAADTPDKWTHQIPESVMKEPDVILVPEIIYRTDPSSGRRLPISLNWSSPLPPVDDGTMQPSYPVQPAFSVAGMPYTLELIRQFREDRGSLSGPCGVEDIIIVGDDPMDEVVIFDRDTVIVGDICILNQGDMRVEGADLTLVGDITIRGGGRMSISGGSFNVPEEFRLQFSCLVMDSANFEIENSQVSFGGQNWSLACAGNAQVTIDNCTFPYGIITALLLEESAMEVMNCTKPGEFIPMENTSVTISGCDSVITWFTFPEFSGGTFEAPEKDTLISHWEFPTASVNGIDYRFVIDSTSNVLPGMLCSEEISLTVENSDVVALGIIFWEGSTDTIEIKGLVNDTHYPDYTLDLEDRVLRLVDTHVGAWNFYPFDTAHLKLENNIFGEIMTSDSSRAEIHNSICDGTGGHVMTQLQSELVSVFSSMLTQVIARNRSIMLFFGTNFPFASISADGSSVMMFINSAPVMRPAVKDTALTLETFIGLPSMLYVDDEIPITGTALITPGPFNRLDMDHYLMHHAPGLDPQSAEWTLIDSVAGSVFQDSLGVWNTHGLDPGYHMLQLTITSTYVDSFRFSIPTVINVYLNEQVGIRTVEGETAVPIETVMRQNRPNPFNPSTTISFNIRGDGGTGDPGASGTRQHVSLIVYDIRGRRVRTLIDSELEPGNHKIHWDGKDDKGRSVSSGMYLYTLKEGDKVFTRKMTVLK
jgi:hypothetical protein